MKCITFVLSLNMRLIKYKYDDYSKTFSIRKFSITDFNTYSILGKVDYGANYNSRMISCFLVPDWEDIVVFFLKAADE